ncbi:PAS domain S-box protein [Ancylomarina euxinus]|uniref:histidine kinase n=1 Tax=Ancylomarina euxinus TaxID=2283627 RepID=A0A425XZ20_9BACT|nr:PAS domain-containing sensor histidine kinase [Ancylomarina euxinus]MCZ4695570.1 PAS domain S-box protein [Ancylomarina euxinus]MUP15951.1 PAS domain S-box protein [Ancylomarina euxinus]RRG20392.1 PAS domain S-box protein [Ancylomarina euxinus]
MRNDELEQLVIRRTSELEAANKKLTHEIEIRKKAEEKLLKKHDHFLKIFSAVPMGLLLLDRETAIVNANQAISSMIFRDPAEIVGRRVGDGLGCVHSFETHKGCGFSNSCPACPLRNGIEQIIAKSTQIHGAELNLSLMINGKPEERCLSVSAEPIDIEGHLHVIVAIDDITDRKKNEEALKESEKRISMILETEPECVKILDLEGKLVYMNPAGLNMIDADNLDQVLGLSMLPLIGEEYKKTFADLIVRTLKGGGGKLEFQVTGLKGRKIWLETNSVPLRLQNDEITGVLGITRDITDRKKVEKKLKRSLSLVTATLESTVDGILVVDRKRKVRTFNKKFVELWRIPDSVLATFEDEKLLASVLSQLSEPEIFLRKVEDLYLTDDESFDVVGFKDGRTFEFYSRPQELDGENIGRVWSFRDVTKRKKAEEALKESKRQLEELNATKDKLFSIIGHDLRSPIGGLKQLVELTLSTSNLSDVLSISEILEDIQKSASATYDLLENLLAWAKSQRNEVVFKPTQVNLYEIIDACTLLLTETTRIKNISIHNQSSPQQWGYADPNMLMTILRNLLTNAIKFTHSGKNIYVSVINTGKDIAFSVKDEGVGINSENLDKLFKPNDFLTTYGTSGEKGTGLGLLLCKEFVEKHSGKIWVESEIGKGSEFKFTIPLN